MANDTRKRSDETLQQSSQTQARDGDDNIARNRSDETLEQSSRTEGPSEDSNRERVIFRRQSDETLAEQFRSKARLEELPSDADEDDDDYEDVSSSDSGIPFPGKPSKPRTRRKRPDLPPWLHPAALHLFHDDPPTASLDSQRKVTAECLPLLTGKDTQGLPLNSHGLPHLRRTQHAAFLRHQLRRLPPPYVAMDASRPWLFYWVIAGLSFLGEDVSQYRERLIDTVRPLQNASGGFGGGHGQYSHCAGTYAVVLALAAVDALEVVDRRAMWKWLGTIKQADGGFSMAEGAEEDIRGAYCAMTILAILNLPLELPPDTPVRQVGLESFTDGLGEWVGRCQTFEGGIAGAPTNEAHGAYAFCALACLGILDAPHKSIPRYLDAPALLAWLARRQTQPEGGFQGRAEKLVDACYSHWVGGSFALIQAAVQGEDSGGRRGGEEIWSREALLRYLLTCAQQPGNKVGGMRDKPSTRPDAYHTCYAIAGLSHAQHHYHYDTSKPAVDEQTGRLVAAFNWEAEKGTEAQMRELRVDADDVVELVHPVFVLPMGAVERARKQFDGLGF